MLCTTPGCWFWAPQHVLGSTITLGFSVNRHRTWWIRICRTLSSRIRQQEITKDKHKRVHQSESGHSRGIKRQPRGCSLPLSCRSLALHSWMGHRLLMARRSCHEDEALWLLRFVKEMKLEMTKFWIIRLLRRQPSLPVQDAQALISVEPTAEALLPNAQALHRSRFENCWQTLAQDTTEKF